MTAGNPEYAEGRSSGEFKHKEKHINMSNFPISLTDLAAIILGAIILVTVIKNRDNLKVKSFVITGVVLGGIGSIIVLAYLYTQQAMAGPCVMRNTIAKSTINEVRRMCLSYEMVHDEYPDVSNGANIAVDIESDGKVDYSFAIPSSEYYDYGRTGDSIWASPKAECGSCCLVYQVQIRDGTLSHHDQNDILF